MGRPPDGGSDSGPSAVKIINLVVQDRLHTDIGPQDSIFKIEGVFSFRKNPRSILNIES